MINRIEMSITDRCNLNCAYCSHYASLCSDTIDMRLEEFREDVDALAELTDSGVHLGTLGILGGEPLLHRDLFEMLWYARQLLPWSRIRITTNGILLPQLSGQELACLRRWDIEILISKYVEQLPYDKYSAILDNNHIVYKFTQQNKITEFYKYSMDEDGKQDLEQMHKLCTLWQGTYTCHELRMGLLYPCSQIVRHTVLNKKFDTKFTVTNGDFMDIRTHSLQEIEEFLQKPVPFCKYCKIYAQHNVGKYQPSKCSKEEFI